MLLFFVFILLVAWSPALRGIVWFHNWLWFWSWGFACWLLDFFRFTWWLCSRFCSDLLRSALFGRFFRWFFFILFLLIVMIFLRKIFFFIIVIILIEVLFGYRLLFFWLINNLFRLTHFIIFSNKLLNCLASSGFINRINHFFITFFNLLISPD